MRLAQQGFRQVQAGVGGEEDAGARAFLSQAHGMLPADGASGPGYMFYTPPSQKNDARMYSKALGDSAAFYYTNGLRQPGAIQAATAGAMSDAERKKLAGAVVNVVGGSALLATGPAIAATVPGLVTSTVTACTINPTACTSAAGIGGIVSGSMDMAGQLFLTGNIRPGQTAMATVSGAIFTPLGMNAGAYGNAVLGSVNSIANAQFQNILYGDTNSLFGAAIIGYGFGSFGANVGSLTQKSATSIFPIHVNSRVPALLQKPSTTAPLIGVGVGNAAQGFGSPVTPFQNQKK